MGFFMKKTPNALKPIYLSTCLSLRGYICRREEVARETPLHRGNHGKLTIVDLNLHQLTVLSPFKHPSMPCSAAFKSP